ncbi:alkaline phosphatase family protein [Gulosibacter sp. 10]|uniref:alkaline phosphatase family protein n=1 Tax=Gulosibacter sp. 10 TaxID=1255570 RepID=UPI00097F39D6|nr:nucleotide pyrophosphatase/phosphodiesterase family protein [Gulosibacter sp. 10]SJM65775.1 Alkaline phosphodiesterase I / Nucleotide pyrophosphatase [Gulosibacter sp. 10]
MEPIVFNSDGIAPTLADVLPNCLAAMRGERGRMGLPAVRGAVVVLVDGLGESLLRTRGGHARHIVRGWRPEDIAVSFPSTTVAGITSLMTASQAGAHGLVGYSIWDRRTEEYRNQLSGWGEGMDPATWQLRSTVFESLVADADPIEPFVVSTEDYRDSGLTNASLRGGGYHGAETMLERAELAARLCRKARRPLVYLYNAELDQIGHKRGTESGTWLERLEELDHAIARLLDSLPEDIGVLITADHGMIDIPREAQIDLPPALLEDATAVAGEPRLRHVYLRDEARGDVRALVERFREAEGDRAWVYGQEELLSTGLYGAEIASAARERIGDIVIAARAPVTYFTETMPASMRLMIGQHGSLTNEETVVPLIRHGAFR